MASLAEQLVLIEKLADVSGGPFPSLQIMLDQILNNLAEKSKQLQDYIKQINDLIKKASDPETRKKLKAQLKKAIKDFKDTLKNLVIEKIAEIKQMYKLIVEGIKRIGQDVANAIAAIALPPALGTVTPNPAYALLIAIQVKHALSGTLSFLVSCFRQMLVAANLVEYVLPEPALILIDTLDSTRKLIDTIPG